MFHNAPPALSKWHKEGGGHALTPPSVSRLYVLTGTRAYGLVDDVDPQMPRCRQGERTDAHAARLTLGHAYHGRLQQRRETLQGQDAANVQRHIARLGQGI